MGRGTGSGPLSRRRAGRRTASGSNLAPQSTMGAGGTTTAATAANPTGAVPAYADDLRTDNRKRIIAGPARPTGVWWRWSVCARFHDREPARAEGAPVAVVPHLVRQHVGVFLRVVVPAGDGGDDQPALAVPADQLSRSLRWHRPCRGHARDMR